MSSIFRVCLEQWRKQGEGCEKHPLKIIQFGRICVQVTGQIRDQTDENYSISSLVYYNRQITQFSKL